MINLKGRLQRLNQAISSPGRARDDWEILRDLIQAISGSNGIYTIDELFKQIAAEFSALEGLSLSRIGDLEWICPANSTRQTNESQISRGRECAAPSFGGDQIDPRSKRFSPVTELSSYDFKPEVFLVWTSRLRRSGCLVSSLALFPTPYTPSARSARLFKTGWDPTVSASR